MPKRVLVVDNDRLCVDLLADILREAGYEVMRAYDGMEAMEALAQSRPDAVFLDIVMPKISGERVFQFIKENPLTRGVPVIILSGTLLENRENLLALGADGYVAKGSREELRAHVVAALKHLERPVTGPVGVLGADTVQPQEKVWELVALREYLEALLRAVGEGVVEVDGRQRVLGANRACLQILGEEESALVGRSLLELFGVERKPEMEDLLARFLAAPDQPSQTIQVRTRKRVVRVTLAPVMLGDSQPGCFVILRDVTDLAGKIEDLSNLNRRLQEMDRMRSELLTMVSHDLHTPLTAIKGSLDVLMHENVGVELTQELLGIARKNADRLFRMVSDILDLARIEAGRFRQRREAFDLGSCLRGTLDRLQHLAKDKGIHLGLTLPEVVAPILADGLRMEQVFTNLLGNALKFTPRGGTIDILVEDRGTEFLVRVTDSGIGIPAEHLDRIFDRFYRVPLPAGAEVEGTGLGLTICKAVLEEHGGGISVESKIGQGTTFFLTIPKGDPTQSADG
jgi:PAS domain S-box-containing protein